MSDVLSSWDDWTEEPEEATPTALVPTKQTLVNVEGGELEGFAVEGVWYVAMYRACRLLGVDWSSQRKRILRDPILAKGLVMMTIPSAGGTQESLCLRRDLFWGWLFKLELSRLNPEARALLTPLQEAGYEALAQRFEGTPPAAPPALDMATLRQLIAAEVAAQLRPARPVLPAPARAAGTSPPPRQRLRSGRTIAPALTPEAIYHVFRQQAVPAATLHQDTIYASLVAAGWEVSERQVRIYLNRMGHTGALRWPSPGHYALPPNAPAAD